MNPAQSETPDMLGNGAPSGPRENREAPLASGSSTPDRLEKATSYTTSMHAGGESDERVVPAKHPNNAGWREVTACACYLHRSARPLHATGNPAVLGFPTARAQSLSGSDGVSGRHSPMGA